MTFSGSCGLLPVEVAVFSELGSGCHLGQAGGVLASVLREARLVQRMRAGPRGRSSLTRVVARLLKAKEDTWRHLGGCPALSGPSLVPDLPIVVLEDLGVQVQILVLLIHDRQLSRDDLVVLLLLQFKLTLAHCVLGLARERPGLNVDE